MRAEQRGLAIRGIGEEVTGSETAAAPQQDGHGETRYTNSYAMLAATPADDDYDTEDRHSYRSQTQS